MIRRTISVVPPPRHGVGHFATWVARSCGPSAHVLNIGAGKNASGALKPLLRRSPYLVGVDPDATIHQNSSLDECFQMSMEDFAIGREERFDLALAVYVLEHVADPDGFVGACARVLKPGGSLFALTLNRYQYFGMLTWASTRLGFSEILLRALKGPDVMLGYHSPTQYRLNSLRTLTRHLEAAGFRSVEFRCYDDTKRYRGYLPRGIRWFAPAYSRAAYVIGAPSLMGHLSFRATK